MLLTAISYSTSAAYDGGTWQIRTMMETKIKKSEQKRIITQRYAATGIRDIHQEKWECAKCISSASLVGILVDTEFIT